jgi:hypothetical protein
LLALRSLRTKIHTPFCSSLRQKLDPNMCPDNVMFTKA